MAGSQQKKYLDKAEEYGRILSPSRARRLRELPPSLKRPIKLINFGYDEPAKYT